LSANDSPSEPAMEHLNTEQNAEQVHYLTQMLNI